jgi:hypothetical protein
MSTFLERLHDERDELKNKYEKLDGFLFTEQFEKLDDVQAALLQIQHSSMKTYLQCLNERLIRLEPQIGFE